MAVCLFLLLLQITIIIFQRGKRQRIAYLPGPLYFANKHPAPFQLKKKKWAKNF